jgi:hypothetical protein
MDARERYVQEMAQLVSAAQVDQSIDVFFEWPVCSLHGWGLMICVFGT